MRYLILIYESEADAQQPTDAEMQEWFDYTDRLKKSGAYVAGEALMPTSTATTVRKKGGKVMTTDGPFAETREQLGGFYLIDVDDLDAALKWGADIPSVGRGPVEVRPVMEFGGE
jgi:hypothetical protein